MGMKNYPKIARNFYIYLNHSLSEASNSFYLDQ